MWFYIDHPHALEGFNTVLFTEAVSWLRKDVGEVEQAAMSDLAVHVMAMRKPPFKFSPEGLNIHLIWLPRILSDFRYGLSIERRDNPDAPKRLIIRSPFLGGRPFPPQEGFEFPE